MSSVSDLMSLTLVFRAIGIRPDCKDPYKYRIIVSDADSNSLINQDPSGENFLICKESGTPTYEFA